MKRKPPTRPRKLVIRRLESWEGEGREVVDSPWSDAEAIELAGLWARDLSIKCPRARDLARTAAAGTVTPDQMAGLHKICLWAETGGTRRSHGL